MGNYGELWGHKVGRNGTISLLGNEFDTYIIKGKRYG